MDFEAPVGKRKIHVIRGLKKYETDTNAANYSSGCLLFTIAVAKATFIYGGVQHKETCLGYQIFLFNSMGLSHS
jgi:hypothetical protein